MIKDYVTHGEFEKKFKIVLKEINTCKVSIQERQQTFQSTLNQKQKEIEQLKDQVAEHVINQTDHEKLKKYHKQLVKEFKTQNKTTKNYKIAAEESETEVQQLNVTVANLTYELTLGRQTDPDENAITVLNNKIKHQKHQIEGLNNSLSDERIINEKLKESKTEYIIKPDKKLEDSKKKLSEEVKFLKKSNLEQGEQIVELGGKLRDRQSHLDKQSLDMEDKVDRMRELEKVLSNYMAVDNGETRNDVDEEMVLNYKLTQIAEFQRILKVIKEELTIGPLVEEGSCSICFDKLAHYPTEQWKCGHKEFCLPCSKKWQNSNPGGALCPICRKKKPVNDREYPSLRKQ